MRKLRLLLYGSLFTLAMVLCLFTPALGGHTLAPIPRAAAYPHSGESFQEGEVPPTNRPCLECHGPFEEMAAAAPIHEVATAKKINPHRYVPHDTKNLPECTKCHDVHPVPPAAEMVVPKANVEWCYLACHHLRDFTPCRECH